MDSQSLKSFMIPGGGYGYTGTPIDDLQSVENTIATGLMDESGSTRAFARQIELCVKEIIKSLRHSAAADKLIYRHCHFDTNFREIHGFKPLSDINEDDYDGCWAGGGQTALYKSCCNIFEATLDYGQKQNAKRYMVNGFAYVVTDGQNYLSGDLTTAQDVKVSLAKIISSESLESMNTILIGVNPDAGVQRDLRDFHTEAGFTQYVEIENASETTLAKLGNFISKSIQQQSQALGSGGPSQSLTF